MKFFPSKLNSKNKNEFELYKLDRCLCYFRRDLYEHILNNNEEIFFDLDQFSKTYSCSLDDTLKMIETDISKELNNLGWKTGLSYGNTALFVYSGEKPKSCWDQLEVFQCS